MYPAYHPAENIPAPNNLLPELTLTAKGKVYLSQPLLARLKLRAGQPINLLPPSTPASPYWHLDLRPDALRNIDWYPGKRPRIKGVSLPDGLLLPGQELTFLLLPGEPEFTHYHPLLPAGPPVLATPAAPRLAPEG
jgi:hypothetical protein